MPKYLPVWEDKTNLGFINQELDYLYKNSDYMFVPAKQFYSAGGAPTYADPMWSFPDASNTRVRWVGGCPPSWAGKTVKAVLEYVSTGLGTLFTVFVTVNYYSSGDLVTTSLGTTNTIFLNAGTVNNQLMVSGSVSQAIAATALELELIIERRGSHPSDGVSTLQLRGVRLYAE